MPEHLYTLDEIGTTRSYDYTEATLIAPHRCKFGAPARKQRAPKSAPKHTHPPNFAT